MSVENWSVEVLIKKTKKGKIRKKPKTVALGWDRVRLQLRCKRCRATWYVSVGSKGKLQEGSWECPNKCEGR